MPWNAASHVVARRKIRAVSEDLVELLVPYRLWELVRPKLPEWRQRRQGGGTKPKDDRASLAAVIFVLISDCPWRELPPAFGVSRATAHRRFAAWTAAGVWDALEDLEVPEDGWDLECEWLHKVRRAARRRLGVVVDVEWAVERFGSTCHCTVG
ncbi:hypothetical protein GCM10018963_06860 [Saccharothrix longispora]